MARLLLGLFLVMPLLEIAGFVLVGQAVGLWPTLLGVVIMGIVGALIVRAQGLALVNEMRASVNRGELPARALADAMMIALAGLLFILPGYVSDLLGLLLLLPPVRSAIYAHLRSRMKVVATTTATEYGFTQNRIEDETIELSDDEWRPR